MQFRKDKTIVELNTAENTEQLIEHLNLLNDKIIETFDLYLAQWQTPSKFARNDRWAAIENMGILLEAFEEKWKSAKNSNKLYWANSAEEAEKLVEKILERKQPKTALNIMGTELKEVDVEELNKKHKIQSLWANWEKALQVLLNENEQHPLFPLMHLSETQLNNALEHSEPIDTSVLNYWIAEHNNQINNLNASSTIAFMNAEFLCPDLGAVCWFDEDGLYGKVLQKADTIVILAGIDRIINSSNNLDVVAGMKSAFTKGEYLPPKLHYVMSNVKAKQEIIIILIDNARTELLKDSRWRNLLLDLDGVSFVNQCHDFPYLQPETNYHPLHFGPISALLGTLFYKPEDFVTKHVFWADTQRGFLPHPYLINYKKLLISLRHELYEANKQQTQTIHSLWNEHEKAINDKTYIKRFQLKRKVQKILGKNRKSPKLASNTFMSEWENKIRQKK